MIYFCQPGGTAWWAALTWALPGVQPPENCSRLGNQLPVDIPDAFPPAERQGHVELPAENLDRPGDAGLAAGAEAIDVGAADHAGARAEREGAQYVLPRADAAVEHHLDLRAHGVDDLRQRRDRRRRAVELPAAVIGDDKSRGPGLGRGPGVLDVEDALEDELARPDAAHPLDVLPAQCWIELAGGPMRKRVHVLHALHVAGEIAEGLAFAPEDRERPGRLGRDVDDVRELDLRGNGHAVPEVAMALAEHLQVDREDQRAALRCCGALDQRLDEAAVLHDVELEPERLADRLRHILDRADRHGRERERDAGGLRRTASQDLAVAMLHAAEP